MGLFPKYQYGNTIEKAINFWYERKQAEIGLSKVLSIENISNNKKLIFYETTNNALMVGLVKKKWNNKWIVVGEGGQVSLNNIQNPETPLSFMWSNLNEFGITLGVIYNMDIESVTIAGKEATLLNKNSNRYIFYMTDNIDSSSPDLDFLLNVKAYGKNNKLIYSYYTQ